MRANARQVFVGELTYSVLVVDSLAEVEQPARGERTPVLYREEGEWGRGDARFIREVDKDVGCKGMKGNVA